MLKMTNSDRGVVEYAVPHSLTGNRMVPWRSYKRVGVGHGARYNSIERRNDSARSESGDVHRARSNRRLTIARIAPGGTGRIQDPIDILWRVYP
ncbi:hypothetical protein D3C84_1163540 [compost metagenome]